jgi:WD40 repeat protein
VGIGLKRSKQILNSPFVKILLAIFLLLFAWKLEVADRLMFPDSVKTSYLPGKFQIFSPSGEMFVTTRTEISKNTEQNHTLKEYLVIEIRRMSDGEIVQAVKTTPNRDVMSTTVFSISPDDALLATVVNDEKQIQIWRISDGQLLHSLEGINNKPPVAGEFNQHRLKARFLAFANSGKTLIFKASQGSPVDTIFSQVNVWNVANGEKRYTFSGEYWDAAISPDGQLLALQILGKPLELYRISDGTMLRQFEEIKIRWSWRFSLKFSPDGKLLAFISRDPNTPGEGIFVYSVRDGSLQHFLYAWTNRGHYEPRELLNDFAFSPDSSYLAASYGINSPPSFFSFPSLFGGEEKLATHGRIRFWSLKDGQPMQTLRGHRKGTNQLAFSSDSKLLATVSGSEMRFWQMPPRNYAWLWLLSIAVVGIVYFGRMYLRYLIDLLQK